MEMIEQRAELLKALETLILFSKPSKTNAVALNNAFNVVMSIRGEISKEIERELNNGTRPIKT